MSVCTSGIASALNQMMSHSFKLSDMMLNLILIIVHTCVTFLWQALKNPAGRKSIHAATKAAGRITASRGDICLLEGGGCKGSPSREANHLSLQGVLHQAYSGRVFYELRFWCEFCVNESAAL